MAKAAILWDDYVSRSTTTIASGDEVTGFEDDNVGAFHPASAWRADVLGSAWLTFDFGLPGPSVEAIAALYTNGTGHRNQLTNSADPTHADWTKSNLTPATTGAVADPDNGSGAYTLTDSVDGGNMVHAMYQTIATGSVASSYVVIVELRQKVGEITQAFAQFGDAVTIGGATDYHRVLVDLAAGSILSNPSSGFTNTSETITALGDDWYRLVMTGTSSADGTLYFHVATAKGGTSNYTGTGEAMYFYEAQVEWGSSGNTTLIHRSGDEEGAAWRIRAGRNAAQVTAAPVYDSKLVSLMPENDLTDWRWRHGIHTPSSAQQLEHWRIDFIDANNADAYLEVPRVVMGPLFQPAQGWEWGWTQRWVDPSDAVGHPGSGYFRSRQKYRVWDVEFQALTDAEGVGEVFAQLDRLMGRRKPVLFIGDSDDDPASQVIYGNLEPMPLRRRFSNYNSRRMKLTEIII